jgi:sorbitol/mannitol transport system permease protein
MARAVTPRTQADHHRRLDRGADHLLPDPLHDPHQLQDRTSAVARLQPDPADWTLENYAEVWAQSTIRGSSGTRSIISVGSTLLALIVAVPAAWAMAFVPGKRTKDILMWMLSTKMMPAVAVLVPIYLIFLRMGLIDTSIGLVIMLMLMNLPIVVWMLYTYFKEIPGEILEAARMDGARSGSEIVHVLTPMAVPGIASTCC